MKRRIFPRILAIFLALLILPGNPAEAAVSAASIRLCKTEGSVEVKKSSGKALSLRENMSLYNGYHVETEESGYAWISLDDVKLLKEDAASETEVRKNGKKLEVNLISGNLFFDVSEPLEEDETLNIRTSTMVVGIRGTSGWVKVVDGWKSQIYLLEGTVQIAVADPVTGEMKSATLHGGDTAECVVYPQDRQSGEKCDILMKKFPVDDIPGFVLTELVRDVPLCDTIYDDSGLDILHELAKTAGGDPSGREPDGQKATPEVLGEARRRQEQDELTLARRKEEIQEQLREQGEGIAKDKVFSPVETSGSSGGGSSSGPVTPEVKAAAMPLTAAEIQALLNANDAVTVQPSADPADNTLTVDTDLNVAAGKTLTLGDGIDVNVGSGSTLSVDGTLNAAGSVANNGGVNVSSGNTLRVAKDLTNSGSMRLTKTGRVIVDGSFTQSGELDMRVGTQLLAKSYSGATPAGLDLSSGTDADGYRTMTPQSGLLWEFDEDTGTLRIFANEPGVSMENYTVRSLGFPAGAADEVFESDAPWDGDCRWNISKLIISDDITNIGVNAFFKYISLTDVVIGSGVTSIGEEAFYNCPITSLTIPEGVTSIGSGAFSGCSSLTSLTIPDSVTSISSDAFSGCSGLTSLTIPDSVTSIGSGAFSGCSSLTGLVLPENVSSVGDYAFRGCSGLTSLVLPENIKSVGDYAFQGCSGLESVSINGSLSALGKGVFDGCVKLDGITVGEGNTEYILEDGVLFSTDKTELHLYPAGGTKTEYVVPDSVTVIAPYAFSGATTLERVTFPEGLVEIGDGAFRDCEALTGVTIPNSVTRIGDEAFYSCANLTSLTIEDSAASIGAGAFKYAELTSADIGNRVTSIGAEAFVGNDLTSMNDSSGSYTVRIPGSVKSIGEEAFHGCRMRHVVLSDGVESIGEEAFGFGYDLVDVDIPASVVSIGANAFYYCSDLAGINVAEDNPVYCSDSGVLLDKDKTVLYKYPAGKRGRIYTIPETVTRIGKSAFYSCENLEQIAFPAGLTTIEDDAFAYAKYLTSLNIPDSVTSIGRTAFNSCKYVRTLHIPAGITRIEWWTFHNLDYLTEVTIPEGVVTIESEAFRDCERLTTVTIPKSVKSLAGYAFNGCNNLENITFNGTVEEWQALGIGIYSPGFAGNTVHCADGDVVMKSEVTE